LFIPCSSLPPTASNKVETYGKPMLGGPWSLVDSEGRPLSSGDLHGGYTLLYFGFTFCPDICPNELVKMGKVATAIGEELREYGDVSSSWSPP
jgi:protein SCO1/2